MNTIAKRLFLVVAALIVTARAPSLVLAQEGRPKTVHDLILELGGKPKEASQLRLKLSGKLVGNELGGLPETIEIEVIYDEAGNRIRVVDTGSFADGAKKQTTSLGTEKRALIWIERTPPEGKQAPPDGQEVPPLEVQSVDAALALPNPWRLPVKLGYTGMFTDAVLGYEALGREYARSARLNREPDERGLLWFDLRPSPGAGAAIRYEFNAGLKVKAGFAADSGWLQVVEVQYAKSDAVMTLTVVERETKLTEAELGAFEFPERVLEAYKNRPKKSGPPGTGEQPVGPRRELEKKREPASASAGG